MKTSKRVAIAAAAGFAVLTLAGAALLRQQREPVNYVLMVEDSPVCQEEFQLQLREYKFSYEQQLREEFALPESQSTAEALGAEQFQRLLLEKNVAHMTTLRVEQALGQEYGVIPEAFTYEGLLAALEAENQRREACLAAGEPIYGLRSFTPEQYYSYYMDALRRDLLAALPEEVLAVEERDIDAFYQSMESYAHMEGELVHYILCDVTAAQTLPAPELEALYAEITDLLTGTGQKTVTRDGITYTAEEKTFTSAQLREFLRQSFDAEFLLSMAPGEISTPFFLGGHTYIAQYLGFDKAETLTESERAVLRLRLKEDAYQQLLAERAATAQVQVNREFLDSYLVEGGDS